MRRGSGGAAYPAVRRRQTRTRELEAFLCERVLRPRPGVRAERLVQTKLSGRSFMLDNPKTELRIDERREKQRLQEVVEARRRRAPRRVRRRLGLCGPVPRDGLTYEGCLPMHRLWCEYAAAALPPPGAPPTELAAVELQGCLLDVVRSTRPDLVGTRGIVLRDSSTAWHLITEKDDAVRVVPKRGATCAFDAPDGSGRREMRPSFSGRR